MTGAIPLAVIDDRIGWLNKRLDRLDSERGRISVEIDVLVDLKARVKPESPRRIRLSQDATSTTTMIEAVIAKTPGLLPKDVADKLADEINTTSEQPRRIIQNSISNMLNKRIRKDRRGCLFILNGTADTQEGGDE